MEELNLTGSLILTGAAVNAACRFHETLIFPVQSHLKGNRKAHGKPIASHQHARLNASPVAPCTSNPAKSWGVIPEFRRAVVVDRATLEWLQKVILLLRIPVRRSHGTRRL